MDCQAAARLAHLVHVDEQSKSYGMKVACVHRTVGVCDLWLRSLRGGDVQSTDYMFAVDDLEEDLHEPVVPDSLTAVSAMLEKVETVLRGRLNKLTESVRGCARCVPRVGITGAVRGFLLQYNDLNAVAEELIAANAVEAFARYSPTTLYDSFMRVDQAMDALEASLKELQAVSSWNPAACLDGFSECRDARRVVQSEQSKDVLRQQFAALTDTIKGFCEAKSAAVVSNERACGAWLKPIDRESRVSSPGRWRASWMHWWRCVVRYRRKQASWRSWRS